MTIKTTFPELTEGQLKQLDRIVLDFIGEDEPIDPSHHKYSITCSECKFLVIRNELKSKQRERWHALMGGK